MVNSKSIKPHSSYLLWQAKKEPNDESLGSSKAVRMFASPIPAVVRNGNPLLDDICLVDATIRGFKFGFLVDEDTSVSIADESWLEQDAEIRARTEEPESV